MVRWLIEHGANVNSETRANYTPLHQAAQQGHNHVVRFLLENGASPNTKTAVNLQICIILFWQFFPAYFLADWPNSVVNCPTSWVRNIFALLFFSKMIKHSYVSVVETLRTVTETTVITETTTITEERYRPQNPEAMNETCVFYFKFCVKFDSKILDNPNSPRSFLSVILYFKSENKIPNFHLLSSSILQTHSPQSSINDDDDGLSP
jgi:hypothetical protein